MLIFAHGVQQKNRKIRFQRHGVCVLRTDILRLDAAQIEHSLFQLLFYRYWNYDLSKPFQEQFEHNQRQLLAFLWEQLGQNGDSV